MFPCALYSVVHTDDTKLPREVFLLLRELSLCRVVANVSQRKVIVQLREGHQLYRVKGFSDVFT